MAAINVLGPAVLAFILIVWGFWQPIAWLIGGLLFGFWVRDIWAALDAIKDELK